MLDSLGRRGQTILLTGPPGAGKTRTSLLWAVTRPAGAFAIDCDYARSTLMTADRLRGSTEMTLADQYKFAVQIIAAQAEDITRSGVDCIVVGARAPFPPPHFADIWTPLDALDPITIVLLPSPDVCAQRNLADPTRIGEFAVAEDLVRGSYDGWQWDRWRELPRAAVIDTSEMTSSQVVDAAEEAVHAILNSRCEPDLDAPDRRPSRLDPARCSELAFGARPLAQDSTLVMAPMVDALFS